MIQMRAGNEATGGFFTCGMPGSSMEQVLRHFYELMNNGKMKRDFANGSI